MGANRLMVYGDRFRPSPETLDPRFNPVFLGEDPTPAVPDIPIKIFIKNIMLTEVSKPISIGLSRAYVYTVQLKGQNSY